MKDTCRILRELGDKFVASQSASLKNMERSINLLGEPSLPREHRHLVCLSVSRDSPPVSMFYLDKRHWRCLVSITRRIDKRKRTLTVWRHDDGETLVTASYRLPNEDTDNECSGMLVNGDLNETIEAIAAL